MARLPTFLASVAPSVLPASDATASGMNARPASTGE